MLLWHLVASLDLKPTTCSTDHVIWDPNKILGFAEGQSCASGQKRVVFGQGNRVHTQLAQMSTYLI